jgi:acetyl-CoA carboxylase biotin carboxyl carrier protein
MRSKIDYEEITKIIDFIESRNLSHFELEIEGFKIKIGRNLPPVISQPPVSESVSPNKNQNPESTEASPTKPQTNSHEITSPMVGTFYRAPDPSSLPFIEIGDQVKKNQTLCIIEAMKLMNEIQSDVDGTLKEIYIKNGTPVEYGQPLFAIQPSK